MGTSNLQIRSDLPILHRGQRFAMLVKLWTDEALDVVTSATYSLYDQTGAVLICGPFTASDTGRSDFDAALVDVIITGSATENTTYDGDAILVLDTDTGDRYTQTVRVTL